MRETLYIRLRAADPGAPTAFCIAAANAVSSFPVNVAPLETVLQQIGTRRLVVLVPSADVRLTQVMLPAKQAAKVLQAAPYALEDQLADDVDTLHFALGARQADGSWPVAVTSHERMRGWLQVFEPYGRRPDAIIPDTLALPVPDEQRFSMLVDEGEMLVRTGLDGGFVCAPEDLDLCLQLADPDRLRTLRVMVPRHHEIDLSALGRAVEPLHGFGSALEGLLQNLKPELAIDLLQGPYSAKQDWLRLWLPWRLAATLAGTALLLTAALHGVQAFQLQRELSALEAQNVARYQQVFPGETRIVDLATQLEQQLNLLKGGAGGSQMLPLLDTLAQSITAVPGLKLQTLQYREGALYAGMTGADLQLLERLRAWYEQPRGAALEVQSANSGSDGVQIRIRLSRT